MLWGILASRASWAGAIKSAFSLSSENSSVRDKKVMCCSFWLRGLLTQESRPNYQLWIDAHCTWLVRLTPCLSRGQFILECEAHMIWNDRTCPQRTTCVSLASWGALITPMSYPNWKDPSTAVKTVKAKVPVIWGWETKLRSCSDCHLTSRLCHVDSSRLLLSLPQPFMVASLSRACLILRECGSCPQFYIANTERERKKHSRTSRVQT